ncbi:hypothetical protein DERP_009140 [Dermatophagoides pteronyssinus]|uniref:Uncharacterized protein n=1 Tax=Dermatophagoides pteronyssinus TaxID=6956 RepID=A0ABQ8JQN4_DERPT|nr:hypothetical protein DERP_009140 [Dermatophagoides pteronyssinus]
MPGVEIILTLFILFKTNDNDNEKTLQCDMEANKSMLFTIGFVKVSRTCIYTNEEKPGSGALLPAMLFTMILPPFNALLLLLELFVLLLLPTFDCG